MRPFADYHTHPQGHRVQLYTLELLQPWIDAARERGIRDLAFTDHDRYHAGIDFEVLDRLREWNPDVKIRAGIELDNDPQTSAAGRDWIKRNWDQLDFVLGSVHYLNRPDQMFDSMPARNSSPVATSMKSTPTISAACARLRKAGWSIAWRISIL
jgi:histidinol-phosphatase (PHP family)